MSATGHQVLSFVTSGEIVTSEMTKNTATVTRFSPALGITVAKELDCVAEFIMLVFAANSLHRDCPNGYDLIATNYH